MLLLLSPSKKLDEKTPWPDAIKPTQPALLTQAEKLAAVCKKLNRGQLAQIMDLSEKLADLNYDRFQRFVTPFNETNARPALFMFKGDVYDKMDVAAYTPEQLTFAQGHVRILSGLYGVLRPLDFMQPYRLEMGRNLRTEQVATLYDFWGETITNEINKAAGGQAVINLASNEYFNAVQVDKLASPLVHVHLKQLKGGQVKTIGLMAKRARGLMADFVIKNGLEDVAALKNFNADGYRFMADMSDDKTLTFLKDMD